MNSFTLVLFVLMVWVSFYAIYFNFIRPVLLTRFQFYVNEVSDEMDLLMLQEKLQPTDEAAQILRSRIEKVRWLIPEIDVTTILLAASEDRLLPKAKIDEEDGTIKSSPDEIKELSRKLDLAAIGAFAANSPFLVGILVMIILGVAMFSAFAQGMQSALTKYSWSAIYSQSQTKSRAVALAA